MSKAIVLDLDETLRSLDVSSNGTDINVVLRPKLTDLLEKLEEVKKKGVDSIIYTSATSKSVNDYFLDKIPEKYRDVFTKIISRDNYIEPKMGTRENYLYRAGRNKMVTVLDYDEILYFDDSDTEFKYLQLLFSKEYDLKYPIPNRAVLFASLPFYPRMAADMYALKEIAKQNENLREPINEYFTLMTKEPGCKIMTEMIDEFVSTDYDMKGLINLSNNKEFIKYEENLRTKNLEIKKEIVQDSKLREKYLKLKKDYYSKDKNENIKEM